MTMLMFLFLVLAVLLPELVVATSLSNASGSSWMISSLSLSGSPPISSSIERRNAFVFSMLKRRGRWTRGGSDNDDDAAASTEKRKKDRPVVVSTSTILDDKIINGDVKINRCISGNGSGLLNRNGDRGIPVETNQMQHDPADADADSVSIPYYAIQSQQHEMSKIDQADLEENYDDNYSLRTGNKVKHRQRDNLKVEESSSSMWAKRNARSISEGVRFKSQLREGLEEKGKLHREQLLSNLLDGVVGGGTTTITSTTTTKGAAGEKGEEDDNNPIQRWWMSVVNRRGKDVNCDREMEPTEGRLKKNVASSVDNVIVPVTNSSLAADDLGLIVNTNNDKEQKNNGNFAARIISGLIMALAEEVEGLDVKVDADANTPLWNKTVHSIKIYFSRLGFRQLRMGGFFSSEFDSSSSATFKHGGKSSPTTADEAFETMDVDKSGALDENELAQALKMAAMIGGNNFVMRSKETLTELASRLVRLYDADGDGVVDRDEYQAMVQDMASLREARIREELNEQKRDTTATSLRHDGEGEKKKVGWLSSLFGEDIDGESTSNPTAAQTKEAAAGSNVDNNIIDVTSSEEFWGSMDYGEGSIVLEGLKLDLRRLFFGFLPGVKRILPGGPLILKPFTATITASFNKEDIMDSFLLDAGLRRLVARALRRRVRGIRDLLDGAVFYGRTWKLFDKDAPDVEVLKLEDVQFDNRNRLIITGRAKIKEALGYKHEPIEQGFKLRTKIGTRANGRIIGLLQPEIAIFAECPKDLERTIKAACKKWFGYTIPVLQPLYTYIPLVSPLKKNDNMDGFNMGEDNQIKSITIQNGKLRFEISAFLRPGRFLGNHYLAFTVPNRTLILTLDRVREGMRNARRNKRLAELAAREVKQIAAAEEMQNGGKKPVISPEGRLRIQRLEKELKATIQEDAILREMEEKSNKENGKSFLTRFVEGYAGAIREELDMEMNARLSSSISDFFGSQDREVNDDVSRP